jgi:integrase
VGNVGGILANYLVQKRRRWYAQLDIPMDVRARLGGKRRFTKSLCTESRSQAMRLVAPVVAGWKQRIAEARGGGDDLVVEAQVWGQIRRQERDPEQQALILDHIHDKVDRLWQQGAPAGVLDAEEARAQSSTLHLADRFAGIALGTTIRIMEHFDAFLAETDVAEKTFNDHKRAIAQLTKRHLSVEEIGRKEASLFVREVLCASLKPATVNRRLSTYRGYWDWLAKRGYVAEGKSNPWDRQSVKVKEADQQDRRAFTEDEGARLLSMTAERADKFPDDYTVTALMAVTGMRIGELTALKSKSVSFEDNAAWITVEKGKTGSAARTIPIVEASLVAELKRRMAEEYVFNHVGDQINQNGRGSAYKKRVTRLVDLIDEDPSLVANHSWRNRAVKLLELGGANRHIADYFVGHVQQGEGLRRYFKDGNLPKLLKAAKLITLPSAKLLKNKA